MIHWHNCIAALLILAVSEPSESIIAVANSNQNAIKRSATLLHCDTANALLKDTWSNSATKHDAELSIVVNPAGALSFNFQTCISRTHTNLKYPQLISNDAPAVRGRVYLLTGARDNLWRACVNDFEGGERRVRKRGYAKPVIKKLGTIDCDMVETTPVVWKGRLYRFEYVRARYWNNPAKEPYFRFVDVATCEATPPFAHGYELGSAFVERDTIYAYGVNHWGGSEIRVFWSRDMNNWTSQTALEIPGWGIYNNSVCKAGDRYIMAIEVGEPPEVVGTRFTIFFAESDDLLHWKLLPSNCVYSRERYTACPAIRFVDGYFYMIYLEARPGPSYVPHIVRSKDLMHWESSPLNPVMEFSDEDKKIANPRLTQQQREHIKRAININNSDVDLCEFQGKVVIYYSWGNQRGTEFLAVAIYDGTLKQFLKGFFPE